MNTTTYAVDGAKNAIVYNARQCEDALKQADFADHEPLLGAKVAAGLRSLAGLYAEHAFHWVRHLPGATA